MNINFCFPVNRLENSRIVLEPLDVPKHGLLLVQGCKDHPELFDYLPYGPFASIAEFEAFYADRILPNPAETMFAILVKSSPSDESGTFAGLIGLLNASPKNASIELGFVNSPYRSKFLPPALGINLTESNRSPSCHHSNGLT
jgi:hypothetical protein